VNLAAILHNTAASFKAALEAQAITLTVEADASLIALADPDRLTQVLRNLLLNALRHTPEGGHIRLVASTRPSDAVQIAVSDTGAGIAADELPHIFERFYRGRETQPADGGTGLGLAIVKKLVEAQGGSVSVESQPGGGSTFSFTLRRATDQAITQPRR